MTATNTPTPDEAGHIWHEKVFSSMKLLCCMNCGFIKNEGQPNKPCPGPIGVEVRSTPELEPAAWENEFGELSHHKPSINPSPLYDAAAIARLTAERDALRDAGTDEQMNNIHLRRDLEAAEKRAMELGDALQVANQNTVNTAKRCYYWESAQTKSIQIIGQMGSENKLLSERVAVLENALEPFAKLLDGSYSTGRYFLQLLICPETEIHPHPDDWGPKIRRARAAREDK